jgi:pectin methylesterase-like acyl-CoA thioesterase
VAPNAIGVGLNCTIPDTNSINAAILMAPSGGTIIVCDGVYNEQVVVNKSVTLAGSGNAIIQPTTLLNDQDAVTVTGATTSATSTIRDNDYTPNSFFACGLLIFDANGVNDDTNVYLNNEKDTCTANGRGGTYDGA